MWQYKLSFGLHFQLGIMISYTPKEAIFVSVPFVSISYGLTADAKGIDFFGKEF